MPCRTAVALLAAVASLPAAAASRYRTGGDCDGFPRVELTTERPLCVGLVADKLGFPRGLAVLGKDIFVLDMGAWGSRRGRLLILPDGGRGARRVLISGLERANAVAPGPGDTLYLGVKGKIVRLDPYAADPAATLRDVVTGLPWTGRHPLSSLAVARDGTLYINVGSATNNCEKTDGSPPDPGIACPETRETPPRASILRLLPVSPPYRAGRIAPYARGLRNSMALAVLPDGRLVAAGNARDAINRLDPSLSDTALPHDTLHLVEPGADYGWPYCYDNRRPSPEYPRADCSRQPLAALLLPAHAAPLGLLHYTGRMARLAGHLIVAYHGYRAGGHRIVAIPMRQNRPSAPPRDIVSGWNDVAGLRPMGAPVSLAALPDGSLLITEDRNGTLLRLSAPRDR
ncbi:PQQ-dependent sugar dehydrogenase [Paludibacterium paludis]|uniref:Glucose/arabinose dehydrogenase n=1 Tax=Paludibacterium paludis TaxID=1225769 RepID=A0A918P408_9NEIS|nr:PQQ-dependent sugar dehydrogenase [Paludibacterium paludis]GGY17769.1 hypothetical protein GCM10011289_21620 [Paludibacterium paludis]